MDQIDAVKVGDKVKVFDINEKRVGQPEGGWDGEVIKVGRALVTITYGRYFRSVVFRLDSRSTNDAYGHQSFKTLKRAATDERYRKARQVLYGVGLEPNYTSKLEFWQLEELADVVNSWEGKDSGSQA